MLAIKMNMIEQQKFVCWATAGSIFIWAYFISLDLIMVFAPFCAWPSAIFAQKSTTTKTRLTKALASQGIEDERE